MKLTPILFLYLRSIKNFKAIHNVEPNKDEKMHMYAKAVYDFNHASVMDKHRLTENVKSINEINYLDVDSKEDRKKCKKSKSKIKR